MLGTKELAEYLNINEKQVYKLIRAKKIPASRITGKWTFPKRLIDQWIIQSAEENIRGARSEQGLGNHIIAMGSNDFAMDVLAHELARQFPDYSLSLANVGSIGGMVALARGICHVAACHLFDPASGTYNVSYLKHYLPDKEPCLVNLVYRDLGLIVRPGNPKKIAGIADLARPDITFINRQQGSGTRMFLDAELARLGLRGQQVQGYGHAVDTHNETAIAVLSGSADAGLGIFSAAKMLHLDFVFLTREKYDLVILKDNLHRPPIAALLGIIQSAEYKKKIQDMGGYDTQHSGTVIDPQ
jgi:putative molybdopterin biosynthesis protein